MSPVRSLDLNSARVLLTNDDGIDADGLAAMERALRPHVAELVVVAPDIGRSATSHAVTFRRPVRFEAGDGTGRYAVSGMPADCVLVGMQRIMADRPPDLVISGVNHGVNLGDDILYSGTIGAAMEACLQHIPSVAVSMEVANGPPLHWDTVESIMPGILRQLAVIGWPRDVFYSVNLPNRPADRIKGVRAAPQGRLDRASSFLVSESRDRRSDSLVELYHQGGTVLPATAIREGDSDYVAIREGFVAVTPLSVVVSHDETLARLRESL